MRASVEDDTAVYNPLGSQSRGREGPDTGAPTRHRRPAAARLGGLNDPNVSHGLGPPCPCVRYVSYRLSAEDLASPAPVSHPGDAGRARNADPLTRFRVSRKLALDVVPSPLGFRWQSHPTSQIARRLPPRSSEARVCDASVSCVLDRKPPPWKSILHYVEHPALRLALRRAHAPSYHHDLLPRRVRPRIQFNTRF